MRHLMYVKMPNAEFNAHVRDGSVGPRMNKILDEIKLEAAEEELEAFGVQWDSRFPRDQPDLAGPLGQPDAVLRLSS